MRVELATHRERWDAYVRNAAPDRPYLRWVWREVIEETFGHQAHYLAAVDGTSICGVLPLVSIRSRLFGNFLVSIPFFAHGGLLADSDEARKQLLAHTQQLARELGTSSVQIRQGDPCAIDWPVSCSKVTMELELPPTVEEYRRRLSGRTRRIIRCAQEHNLRALWGGAEAVPVFYKIFAISMRNLGTPVYPRRFFDNQVRLLADRIRILTLWKGNQPIGAAFLTTHDKVLEVPWSATLAESRGQYSPYLLYWTYIEKAIAEGLKRVDLGRSTRGSGPWEFKRHWRPIERPLNWYHWFAVGAAASEPPSRSSKFELASLIWKRLPLRLANAIGPHLVRSIP